MAINIVPLDNSHETDPSTVLVGKDVLIMFKPSRSLVEVNKVVAQLIGTSDLLTKTETLEKLRNLQILTDEIADLVGNMIRLRDVQPLDRGLLLSFFSDMKKEIIGRGERIAQIEDELQLYFAEEHRICFCAHCHAFLGLATDPLPPECKVCKEKTTKDITKAESLRYLDGDMRNYLQGIWIQDYVAKILKEIGWEVWTECDVMGSSGVYHQIDILAIDKTQGKVAIAECKRSATGDHAFKLVARFIDIQPSFGLLISLNKLNSDQGRNLLSKKPGLKLIELTNCRDTEIKEILMSYISREN